MMCAEAEPRRCGGFHPLLSRRRPRFLQHPADIGAVYAKATRDLGVGQLLLGFEAADLGRLGAHRRLPAFVPPFGFGLGNALALALQHDAALELGDGTEHVDHELADRRVRVGRSQLQDVQLATSAAYPADDRDQVGNRSRQAVDLSHDQRVALAQDPIEHQVELRPHPHARHLLTVDVALGTPSGFEVADLSVEPRLLVKGRGPRNALETAPMEPNVRRILRLMIVTAQRKGEVMGIRELEIDRERNLWVLPADRAKNGREHLIPLSATALRILAEAGPNKTGYLFPSRLTSEPYRGQSIDHATRYLFDPRALSKPTKRRKQKIATPPPLAGLMERFTPHDLRRTAATRMRELGISRGDVKMVLNHVESDVTARYDRYDGLAEKRRALDLWSKRLEQIITGEEQAENVVELARA